MNITINPYSILVQMTRSVGSVETAEHGAELTAEKLAQEALLLLWCLVNDGVPYFVKDQPKHKEAVAAFEGLEHAIVALVEAIEEGEYDPNAEDDMRADQEMQARRDSTTEISHLQQEIRR